MKIKLHERAGGTMKLEAFADKHDLVMRIEERSKQSGLPRYYAHFENCEVAEDGALIGSFGNGNTPEEAMADYAREIEGKRLVVDAFGPFRRAFDVPNDLTVAGAPLDALAR